MDSTEQTLNEQTSTYTAQELAAVVAHLLLNENTTLNQQAGQSANAVSIWQSAAWLGQMRGGY
jgi:hypothetical protein